MSNLDGHDPNFDELKAPGKETAPEEQAVELAAEPTAEQPPEAEGEQVEIETAQRENCRRRGSKKVLPRRPEKGRRRAASCRSPWCGALASLSPSSFSRWFFQVLYLSTAIYLVSVGLVAFGVWRGRETNTAYTVLLACAWWPY